MKRALDDPPVPVPRYVFPRGSVAMPYMQAMAAAQNPAPEQPRGPPPAHLVPAMIAVEEPPPPPPPPPPAVHVPEPTLTMRRLRAQQTMIMANMLDLSKAMEVHQQIAKKLQEQAKQIELDISLEQARQIEAGPRAV